jgi:hypothetical protein
MNLLSAVCRATGHKKCERMANYTVFPLVADTFLQDLKGMNERINE